MACAIDGLALRRPVFSEPYTFVPGIVDAVPRSGL